MKVGENQYSPQHIFSVLEFSIKFMAKQNTYMKWNWWNWELKLSSMSRSVFFPPNLAVSDIQNIQICVNNTEPCSYYSPFIFSAWCGQTDQIDLCDKHCKRASPGGSATDCVCVFPDGH